MSFVRNTASCCSKWWMCGIASALLFFRVLIKFLLKSPLFEELIAPQGFHNGGGKWTSFFFCVLLVAGVG